MSEQTAPRRPTREDYIALGVDVATLDAALTPDEQTRGREGDTDATVIRRIQQAAAIANRETTGEGERSAAIAAVQRLCEAHGLDIEQFGFYFVVGEEEWEAAKFYMDQGWMGSG